MCLHACKLVGQGLCPSFFSISVRLEVVLCLTGGGVSLDGQQPVRQRVQLPSLPAQSVAHVDAGHIIAAGWDGVMYTIKTNTSSTSGIPDQEPHYVVLSTGQSLAGNAKPTLHTP